MSTLHPWLYRFGFPGFAETEWVLPAGVDHDEPWYELLPANMACQDLLDWSLDPLLEDKLRDLFEAIFGYPTVEPAELPFYTLLEPLREAFSQGELVAWVLRGNSVTDPARLPKTAPARRNPGQELRQFHLVALEYVPVIAPGAEDPKPLLCA